MQVLHVDRTEVRRESLPHGDLNPAGDERHLVQAYNASDQFILHYFRGPRACVAGVGRMLPVNALLRNYSSILVGLPLAAGGSGLHVMPLSGEGGGGPMSYCTGAWEVCFRILRAACMLSSYGNGLVSSGCQRHEAADASNFLSHRTSSKRPSLAGRCQMWIWSKG